MSSGEAIRLGVAVLVMAGAACFAPLLSLWAIRKAWREERDRNPDRDPLDS